MKILAIRAENLASLGGSIEVDLEGAPLGTAGVFAIVGPTGAGKSTLLDALCLALFDKTPRLANRGGPLIGARPPADDKIDTRLSSNDVRGLIRRGQTFGWAEVDFRVENGVRYRARWETRRAKNHGRWQAQTMSLVEIATGRRIGDKKTEVLAAIEERLGLDFDQFQRSVLLAQGDFASFLKAAPTERSELLEKMTRTEIYGELSMEVHKKSRELAAQTQALTQQKDRLGLFSEQHREALNNRLLELDAGLLASKTNLEQLRRVLTVFEQKKRLYEQEKIAIERAATMDRVWATREHDRQWLDRLAIAEPARELVVRVESLGQRVDADERRVEALTSEVLRMQSEADEARAAVEQATRHRDNVRTAFVALQPQLERARLLDQQVLLTRDATSRAIREHTAATNQEAQAAELVKILESQWSQAQETARRTADLLQQHARYRPLFLEWDRVETQLKTWGKWEREHRDATKHLEDVLADHERLLPAVAQAQKEHATALERLRQTTQNLAEAQAQVSAVPLAAILAERKQVEQRRTILERALALVQTKKRCVDTLTELQQRLSEQQEIFGFATTTFASATAQLETCRAQLDEVSRTHAAAREALELVDHRSLLISGQPCPLCGSESHPWADSAPPLSSLVHDLSERVLQLQQQRETVQQQLADAIAGQRVSQEEQRRIMVDQAKWRHQIETIDAEREALVHHGNDAGLNLGSLRDGDPKPIETLHQTTVEALLQLEAREKEALALGDRLTEARATMEAAKSEVENKIQQIRDLEDEVRQIATRKETAHARQQRAFAERSEAETMLSTHLEMVPNWRSLAQTNLQDALTNLRTKVQIYSDLERQQHESAVMLGELQSRTVPIRAAWDHAKTQVGDRLRELETAVDQQNEAQRARDALWEGKPTDEVFKKYRTDVDLAETALETINQVLASKSEQAAAVAGRLAQAAAGLLALRNEHVAAVETRDNLLYSLGLELEEARSYLAVDPQKKQELAASLEQAWREKALAHHVCDEKRAERLHYEQTHTTTGNESDAADAVRAGEIAYETMLEERSDLWARLNHDNEKQTQAFELTDQLNKKQAELDVVAELNELIGSADGKKFRTFAQSLTLDSLLALANLHLKDLAPRYRLERIWGQDLDLQVRDQEMGDDVRAVQSLSGGETFLASLALALALSSLTKTNTRIESLFIDEGFGTLDGETLEMVLHTLDSLQATGRQVGIISHVSTLAERIGTRIEIVPTGGGQSQLRIRQR